MSYTGRALPVELSRQLGGGHVVTSLWLRCDFFVSSCARTFKSVEEMELHISLDNIQRVYTTNLTRTRLGWKISSLTLSEDDSTSVIERQGTEPFQSNLSEEWALHKPKGGAVRFSEKIRQYLTSNFEIGEQCGRREVPRQVSQDMRKAKGENGERLFSQEEWLTKAQIQGFFSWRDCKLVMKITLFFLFCFDFVTWFCHNLNRHASFLRNVLTGNQTASFYFQVEIYSVVLSHHFARTKYMYIFSLVHKKQFTC